VRSRPSPGLAPGSTTQFYERTGYSLVARVPNFYRLGDDKLIYAKTL